MTPGSDNDEATAARPRRAMSSEYMLWAKTRSQARFNLAASGMPHYPLARLPVRLEDFELSGPSFYGYGPLQEAIARKCGVPADCVVAADGTSMANHLALAALVEPGDEVLVEHPAYELLVSTAAYIGAEVRRFPRRPAQAFRLDPEEIARHVTRRTKLIVITNLHNPSSAYATEETLAEIGEIARRAGALVLVDEVYLDAAFEESAPTAFRLGGQFVSTSSLTKVYGLSGLRCGWVLAAPELARRVWRLNDLFNPVRAHPAERLSVVALAHLDEIRAHARALLEENRALLNEFFAVHNDLEWMPHQYGTVSFPRLRGGDAERLCELLREKYETTVVPGKFFGLPEHFRLGITCDKATLAGGLERIGAALDELKRRA